jgi:hypothetical protein
MSNQTILWGTLIVPWLSLIFMKKEDIKRFMPAGLLAVFLSLIVSDIGVKNGWWYFRETTYPFALLSSYSYGLFPIIPMWILTYTYERFWQYVAVEAIFNIIFAFVALPWFGSRGIIDFSAGLIAFLLATLISFVVYGFQRWQEGFAVTHFAARPQPLAAKPLLKEQNPENEDNR